MGVGEYCNREVVIAFKDNSVQEAAELMRRYHVGDLVVVESDENRVPVGIVTDRDLVIEVMAQGISPESVTAADVMSQEIFIAREEDGLWETLQRMSARGVRRMPVVDAHNGLVGIISLDDVLEFLSEEISALAKITRREIEREMERRRSP